MRSLSLLVIALVFTHLDLIAQADRWQQRITCYMDIQMDVNSHQYAGQQRLIYQNNSPEELNKAFFHLYFNAFQPGSMMDVRSRSIEDPDSRIGDRISQLEPDQQGWMKVNTLKLNGKECTFKEVGTVLEVKLPEPIKAGAKVVFEMEWNAQVPIQIRRSGRSNAEGIAYSMSQWYPKIAEYDYEGWHADPYVGREFYGAWGDYFVNIHMDKKYMVAASGVCTNPKEVGYGYVKDGDKLKLPLGDKLTWKFEARDVHDFMWAADPDYVHTTYPMEDGPTLHFFYQDDPEYADAWREVPSKVADAFRYMSEHFGEYPYPVFNVIQGGDGGMEYPMSTLVTGRRSVNSLLGVTVHEAFHSWYQGVLGSNEALYEWMDEGFTSFGTSETMHHLRDMDGEPTHEYAYQSYIQLALSGKENPMSTHADHYSSNYAYGVAAYSKGEVFVNQLGYIIGRENLDQTLLNYFETWKFKHPNPNDFKRIAELQSGMELDWYLEYFVNSTRTIDYAIKAMRGAGEKTRIELSRKGEMPMPLDVLVVLNDGSEHWYNIPLQIMRGEKPTESDNWTILDDWPWTHPSYVFEVPFSSSNILAVVIDPYNRMADVDKTNNGIDTQGDEDIYLPGN